MDKPIRFFLHISHNITPFSIFAFLTIPKKAMGYHPTAFLGELFLWLLDFRYFNYDRLHEGSAPKLIDGNSRRDL
mgnify:CR=1 FL=1